MIATNLIRDKQMRVFIGLWWQEQQHLWNMGLKTKVVKSMKELRKATKLVSIHEMNNLIRMSGFLIKPFSIKVKDGTWCEIRDMYVLTL